MPKTALFVRIFTDWDADARLYVLSEPIKAADGRWFRKVIVATGNSLDRFETVVYAANEDGTMATMEPIHVLNCNCDHEKVLKDLGYEMEIM